MRSQKERGVVLKDGYPVCDKQKKNHQCRSRECEPPTAEIIKILILMIMITLPVLLWLQLPVITRTGGTALINILFLSCVYHTPTCTIPEMFFTPALQNHWTINHLESGKGKKKIIKKKKKMQSRPVKSQRGTPAPGCVYKFPHLAYCSRNAPFSV